MMNIRNTLRGKDGVALLTVVLIFLVMVIMVAGMSVWSMGNMTNSKVSNEHTAAFYAAEAGINTFMTDLGSSIESMSSTTITPEDFFDSIDTLISAGTTISLTDNSGVTTSANVLFVKDGVNADGFTVYKIISTGTVGGITRTLEKEITLKYTQGTEGTGFTIDKAVLASGNISIGNSTVTSADSNKKAIIGTYSNVVGSVTFHNNSTVDEIQLLEGVTKNVVAQSSFRNITNNNLEYIEFPIIMMPELPTMAELGKLPSVQNFIDSNGNISKTTSTTLTQYTIPQLGTGLKGYYVPTMHFTSGGNIDIISNRDVFIVTDQLFLNSNVSFSGTGKITIYVRGNSSSTPALSESQIPIQMAAPNGSIIGRSDNKPQNLLIYSEETWLNVNGVATPYRITISNNSRFYGSFYYLNTNFTMNNNSGIVGYFVTGGTSVIVANNGNIGTTLYYAPNAKFEILQNGGLNGAVITKNFTLQNQAVVTYNPMALANFPFQIFDPNAGGDAGTGPSVISFVVGPTIEH